MQGIECNRPIPFAIPNFRTYCEDIGGCGESEGLGYCNQNVGQCCCYAESSGEPSRLCIPVLHQIAISCDFLHACPVNFIKYFYIISISDSNCQPVQPTTVEPTEVPTVQPSTVEPTDEPTEEPTVAPTMEPVNTNCTRDQDSNVNIGGSMTCTGIFRCIDGQKDCSDSLIPFEVIFADSVFS